ncbi:hypothetical phage protein [Campylobacter phage CPt10]|uniref:Uncharacterized protein n=2 Tax=Firehammervirus CPt10 TaxID=722418 RepID=A0A410T792_9CAUD|nr:hypothetical protein APL46_gp116 [Campylobacter phage CPt10]QAU04855.1 hypothetical protein [Campylobacter phage CP20]CBJ94318.1 hypothetical phage protein [Campylobacter phage CPt10]
MSFKDTLLNLVCEGASREELDREDLDSKDPKIKETDSGDIDTTPTTKADIVKRKDSKINEDADGEIDSGDDSELEPLSKEEFDDIINSLDPDTVALIISILNDNGYIVATKEEILSAEDFEDIGYLVLEVLEEIAEYEATNYEQYGANPVDESFDDAEVLREAAMILEANDLSDLSEQLVDIAHTKQLRRDRKRSAWKRSAVLRARFRKTGEGRRERKKALKYLKKYRRQHKARLKRYSQKYKQVWKGNTKN